MSGLETAIRNALDRAERGDGQVRARIYQSARQALDAGLRKQGVTDNLVIMQQRKRLEEKINEIEDEEIDRLAEAAQPPLQQVTGNQPEPFQVEPVVELDARTPPAGSRPAPEIVVPIDPPVAPNARATAMDAGALGGVTRSVAGNDHHVAPSMDAAGAPSVDRDIPVAAPAPERPAAEAKPIAGKGRKGRASLDVPPERSAKPRRRRSFLSHLITWFVTLAVVAVGCWLFYQSGMVQSIVDDAIQSANRPAAFQGSGQGPSALSSRGGFSEEWTDIFQPTEGAVFRAGPQAQAQIATGSEGQALRVTSATPNEGGDVAIEVPAEILRELAGKSSTIALTIQSAANQPSQVSVRCDFGSLGTCSRHRFTATQEKLDALFKVTFDRSIAPNSPGRLIFNSSIQGTDRPVFIYSVRVLPGQ